MIQGISNNHSAQQRQIPPEPKQTSKKSSSVRSSTTASKSNMSLRSVNRSAFILNQNPDPLPSGVGSTEIFSMKGFTRLYSAMYNLPSFILRQYPDPLPNKIGEEDFPNGIVRSYILSGQRNPLSDLSRGIIQVDNIKVLFDARA